LMLKKGTNIFFRTIMRSMKYFMIAIIFGIIAGGCGKNDNDIAEQEVRNIIQQEDGSIVLDLREAYLLQDSLHPDRNTAEWTFNIQDKGRYELWLSSFTKDTMDLKYESPVIINFGDKKISARPIGNEIVLDTPGTGDVYFRADSKLGSVYIDQPGDYNIQIVSAKVRDLKDKESITGSLHTQLRSLILKPAVD